RLAGEHRGGRAAIGGLVEGVHKLIVWPEDSRWLPNLPVEFRVEPGAAATLHVALEPACAARVRVEDARGVPLAGVRVQLLRPAPSQVVRDHRELLRHGGSRGRINVRLASAATDDRGLAVLRWHHGAEPLELRLDGAGIAPMVVGDVRLGPQDVVVQVRSHGLLELAVRGAAGARVVATDGAGRRAPPEWSAPCTLDQHGAGRMPLPAGDWAVAVEVPVGGGWRAIDLADGVRVVADRTTRVERDLSEALSPASWAGSAFVDGQPLRALELEGGEPGPDGAVRCISRTPVVLDERGRFAIDGLLPGPYALWASWNVGGRPLRVPVTGWIRLDAGERRRSDPFAVATGRLDLRLVDEHGRPVTGGLLIARDRRGVALLARPDANGVLAFERVPVGEFELSWRSDGRAVEVGRVDVVGGVGGAAPRRVEIRGR
ncbi:MAG: hypothetical protein KAI24_26615, partial [Planctomycetes bacterium]|nr:hypothetical protein [Planctomycetota bacterium]